MTSAINLNPLSRLVGDWLGQEEIQSSKWGEGGSASAQVRCREALEGNVFIQEYAAERDGKRWLEAHAIFSFDASTSACSLFWFDSLGFIPEKPAQGSYVAQTLSFVRTSARGQTRHTYVFIADGLYKMRLESSFDRGSTWSLVMKGTYTRAEL